MSEVTDFLLEAKGLIDSPEKWIKDTYEKNGCYCAEGAMNAIVGYTDETFFQSYHILRHVVDKKRFSSIPAFNDHPATTHGDVMEVFDLAIEE